MVDFKLQPDPALIGQAIEIEDAVLDSVQFDAIVSVAPFKGQWKAVNAALLAEGKPELPAIGSVTAKKNIRCMWVGQGQWFAIGKVDFNAMETALSNKAAVTDQSDAWAVFSLTGRAAPEVLSRLCPLDFDGLQMGQTARTEFAHMMSVITPIQDGFEVMVMRSFAKTAIQSMVKAMQNVASRTAL